MNLSEARGDEMGGFYRSRDQKWIAGVCGGLAERFSINPNLVRLIFVGLVAFGGLPILAVYLLLWMMLPVGPEETPPPGTKG